MVTIDEIEIDETVQPLQQHVGSSGAYGCVYRGSYRGKPAAVRKISAANYSPKNLERLESMRKLTSHANVVKYYAITRHNDGSILIAMELCAGTLEDFVDKSYKGRSPGTMAEMMRQLTMGLQYLHSNGIVHRDIRPQNVMISKSDYDGLSAPPKMKLADYVLVMSDIISCNNLTALQQQQQRHTTDDSAAVVPIPIGALGWQPSEFYPDERDPKKALIKYSKSADVFSLGCVFGYAFTGGHHPFGNDNLLREGNIVACHAEWSEANTINDTTMIDLIRRMIHETSGSRPSLSEILGHPMLVDAKMRRHRSTVDDKHYDELKQVLGYEPSLIASKLIESAITPANDLFSSAVREILLKFPGASSNNVLFPFSVANHPSIGQLAIGDCFQLVAALYKRGAFAKQQQQHLKRALLNLAKFATASGDHMQLFMQNAIDILNDSSVPNNNDRDSSTATAGGSPPSASSYGINDRLQFSFDLIDVVLSIYCRGEREEQITNEDDRSAADRTAGHQHDINKTIQNARITIHRINEIIINYIPDKLSDAAFKTYITYMFEAKSMGYCLKLFGRPFDDATRTLLAKIVERTLSTMGHERLEQFLFTPTHMGSCLIVDLSMQKDDAARFVFEKFHDHRHKSARIDRSKPLLNFLNALLTEDSATSFEEALLAAIRRCSFERLIGDDSPDCHDATPAPTSTQQDFAYLAVVMEHLFKLLVSCMTMENNTNINIDIECYNQVTRPIFQLIDSNDSHNGSYECSNGLATLMLFAFLKILLERQRITHHDDDKHARQHNERDDADPHNGTATRRRQHQRVAHANKHYGVYFRKFYSFESLCSCDADRDVRQDCTYGAIASKLRRKIDSKRHGQKSTTLGQVVDDFIELNADADEDAATRQTAPAEAPDGTTDAAEHANDDLPFKSFTKRLLQAAITNDWLK